MWELYGFLLLASGHVSHLAANHERFACDLGGGAQRRGAYYQGDEMQIVLAESDRLDHKLLNAVLGIMITQKLGYRNVTTMPYIETFPRNVTDFYHDESKPYNFPYALINVGLEQGRVVEHGESIGYVGTSRHHRWYMHAPQKLAGENCEFAQYLKFYAHPKKMSECFQNITFLQSNDPLLIDRDISKKGCKEDPCLVVVLPFNYENETNFLTQCFDNLSLNLEFVFLGNRFYSIVTELKDRNKFFLFVDDILWEGFDELITPDCKSTKSNNDYSMQNVCPYDSKPPIKFEWYRNFDVFPLIHEMLKKWKMNDTHIANLTKTYWLTSNAVVETVACNWMKSSPEVIESWAVDTKPEIVMYANFCNEDYSTDILRKVTEFTKEYINEHVPNNSYAVVVNVHTFDCSLYAFSSLLKKLFDISLADDFPRTAGIIVPSIYQALDMMAGLSNVFRIPLLTYSPNGPSFGDRVKYRNAFRTTGEKIKLTKAYIELFKQFGWKRVAAISGYNQSNVDFIAQLGEHFHSNDQIFRSVKITKDFDIRMCIEDLKSQKARIILVDVEEYQATALFLAAHDLGMLTSKGFMWLLPDWTHSYHLSMKEMKSETRNKIEQVINGHLSLTFSSIGNDKENSTISKFRNALLKNMTIEDDSAVGFVADAIFTITKAVHNLLVEKIGAEYDIHCDKHVNMLSSFIEKNPFEGVSGEIEYYNGAVRISHIRVKIWTAYGPKLIAQIKVDEAKDDAEWKKVEDVIEWQTENNIKPDDGTIHCMFQNTAEFYPKCSDGLYIGGIIFILFLISTFVITSVICVKRHKKEIEDLLNSFNNTRLDLTNRLPGYEVPRDNIELSWEIGRGSFGKVFGGYLKMDDDSWSEVAIKLLKCDARAEDENDFLYEAKTMASFNHKNIVKLMAVCTAGTPILIAMELMLHEDLKKFLVTKKHLVDDPDCAQMKCITPRGLTKMAHDVAMGLSYLASKKFVHRDIASRNCMVNVHGVVKIGDFGMARYVFSKGEYLCQRKALFPVRWMAPESLSEGTFTSMSDMWSYGILIYEIITFGGTPYGIIRDSSNVKEFVVNGNIIRLPNAINPQLKWLIEQCWSYDDSKRPSAADVVVYLADRPSLLHACLEGSPDHRRLSSRCTADETATVLFGGVRGCDTGDTDTSTIDYTAVHERTDSGYDDDSKKDSIKVVLT